jgi:hypothetical protein
MRIFAHNRRKILKMVELDFPIATILSWRGANRKPPIDSFGPADVLLCEHYAALWQQGSQWPAVKLVLATARVRRSGEAWSSGGRMLDGRHRLCAAMLLGHESIRAQVYSSLKVHLGRRLR